MKRRILAVAAVVLALTMTAFSGAFALSPSGNGSYYYMAGEQCYKAVDTQGGNHNVYTREAPLKKCELS